MAMMRFTLTMIVLAMCPAASAQQPVVRPADPARSVTLPLNEYNRLIDLANRPPDTPPPAPVAAVVAGASLQIRVDREAVRGTFTLVGDVLRPGTQRVPLLAGGTLIDATLAGRPLPMVSEKESHAALLEGPGPFTATLEWGGALTFTPGRATFTVPVPQSGTARAVIDVPGEQADLRVTPGLITSRTARGGRTLVEVTLDPGSTTQVSWSMRDTTTVAAARDVRALADVLSLVTIGESDLRLATLVDINVIQGEPRTFTVELPQGYELISLSGNSLETSAQSGSTLTLTLSNPAARRHQFLFALERAHAGGTLALDTGFLTVPGVQRERGEVAIAGVGTLELVTKEREGLTRIDVRELSPALSSLARESIVAAFRYQGTAGAPSLAFDVTRFGDAGVLAAVAERATATTLITTEGRALTEIVLRVQNRAQPFLKVTLPAGASMVSVEVAGQSAKPALGTDGTRVPLLRAGFRPTGPYTVSFVYLHDGAPFMRKGDVRMVLPRMDVPVSIVEWEVFVPEMYRMQAVGGNVIDRTAFPVETAVAADTATFRFASEAAAKSAPYLADLANAQETTFTLSGSLGESETGGAVISQAPLNQGRVQVDGMNVQAPSQNVIALQQRAAGVLPVRVNVPRTGASHRFVRALVVDEETTVDLKYRRK